MPDTGSDEFSALFESQDEAEMLIQNLECSNVATTSRLPANRKAPTNSPKPAGNHPSIGLFLSLSANRLSKAYLRSLADCPPLAFIADGRIPLWLA